VVVVFNIVDVVEVEVVSTGQFAVATVAAGTAGTSEAETGTRPRKEESVRLYRPNAC